MKTPKKQPSNNKAEQKFDCAGCKYCCEFVILKITVSKAMTRKLLPVKKTRRAGYLIMGDPRGFDSQFFNYHNIKITRSNAMMLYELPQTGLFWKQSPDGKEVWFKAMTRCKKLSRKLGLCKIYNRRPEVCKNSGCMKLEPDWEAKYEKGWQEV